VRYLRFLGGSAKRIRKLPFAGGWTVTRDFPVPQGKTFRELYRKRRAA
jgi:L-lactate dehydrogenase complex protein LldF